MTMAVFIVNIATVNAQVSRLSIDTVPKIKRVVTVLTHTGPEDKSFCVPVLHVDRKIFTGSKKELLSLTGNTIAPNVASDRHVVITQGTTSSIYEKQRQGHWEQLSTTQETISEVRIIGKEVFATLKNMPVKEYKLAQITNENMLKTVPMVTHWDFISYW